MTRLVMGVFFTLIGGFAIVAAVGIARQERRLAQGVTVPGEIVDLVVEERRANTAGSMSGTRTYTYPVVRFRTLEGHEVTQKSQYASTGGQDVGGAVNVVYDRADPTLVRVAGSSVGKLGIAVAGGVGSLFVVLGIVFMSLGAT